MDGETDKLKLGDTMEYEGHKLVLKEGVPPCLDCSYDYDCSRCSRNFCDKCFFADKSSCPDCTVDDIEGIWVEVENGTDS